MKKSLLVALATAGMALFAADAAMAHNYHSSCEKGVNGWHRHAWKYGQKQRISCQPVIHRKKHYGHHNKPHCVEKCNWAGPFKQCKTVCN